MSLKIPFLTLSPFDIAIPMIGQKSCILLEDSDLKTLFLANQKVNSQNFIIFFKENKGVFPKSLLCTIESTENIDSNDVSYLNIEFTVAKKTLDIKPEECHFHTEESKTVCYVNFSAEELNQTLEFDVSYYYPPHVIQDSEYLLKNFASSEKFSNIGPKRLANQLVSNEISCYDKINKLANYILLTNIDRLDYIQAESPSIRYVLLLKAMNDYLVNRKDFSGISVNYTNLLQKTTVIDSNEIPVKSKNARTRFLRKANTKSTKKRKKLSWRQKLEASEMPQETKEKVMREVVKIENTPKASTEHAQVSDYLRWVLDVPWGEEAYKNVDLKSLRKNLDTNHYGLNDVKDHLVELMCLQELKKENSGSVLCFVGPAGTGKTSIAKSIADSSNRPVIHIALGGLTDVTEFRGYRRTYIAARPGRLVSEVISKKSLAPLIILDEIDKMQAVKGDPSAALLEILDPEQNSEFTDHYLEVPVDLSKAMFVCTANYEDQIPAPLKDRMELIRFRSYSSKERDTITRKFIMPKVFKESNPTNLPVSFEEDAIVEIVKIVQIRQIEKLIAKLIRRGVTQVHVYTADSYTITKDEVLKIKNNYKEENKKKSPKVGF